MKRHLAFAAVLISLISLTSPASAVVLYDEATQGDLAITNVSILEAGLYTVSATTERGFSGGTTDFDDLFISVAEGLQITDGVAEISGILNQTTRNASPSLFLSVDTRPLFETVQQIQFSEDVLTFTSSDLPNIGDRFRISSAGGCSGCVGQSSYTFDWTYTLTVDNISQAPVGASIWLMISACAALFSLRRANAST